MAFTANDIKNLREMTGAGMMECKKALTECNGNIDEAAKYLKEKGLAAAAKRADRATAEGRLFMRQDGNKIYVVEMTCETDFVANNADFIALGEKMLDVTIAKGYTKVEDEHNKMLEDLKVSIRENMNVAKVEVIDVPANGVASFYIHSDKKTGAVVAIDGSTADDVKTFAYDCCLHIAAFTPAYTSKKDVPESYIAEQKEIFKAQMDQDEKMAGKPDNVKEGILQGKVNKHLAEICFEDQMFVKDDKKTVAAKLAETGKAVGATLTFATSKLFVLGK
ncbi:MAG: translation elongation factor Ts [Treponema sp.]|nr:elongation factor Ts [Treponema sp.]MCI5665995.1 translation elongation factor Ts [Spirochaetia bacterium]MDD7768407.1 translation elongation factor Ts [Treponema sp.]MDY3130341.1 translation elongation factor Ts [Treponema sp.]